ncbi:MAG TPA: hypothetical protein PKC70_04605, partial [Cellvibrionaceae bacterium]|nr:hypothetical protein [Cellvibrionaceae bacterium]
MSELPANPFYKPYLLQLLAIVFFASVAAFLHFVPLIQESAPNAVEKAGENKPARPAGGNARTGGPVTVQTGLAQLRDLAVVESGLGTVVPAAEVLVQ